MANRDDETLREYKAARRKIITETCSERRQELLQVLDRAKDGSVGRKELEDLLQALRDGAFDADETYTALHIFGEAGFLPARPDVERRLQDPDSELRSIALNVLVLHWCVGHELPHIGASYARQCEEILLSDPEDDVRRMAATCLPFCFEKGRVEARIGRLLAQIVRDDSTDKYLRKAAYESLFVVRGIARELWPDFRFKFPDQVDWSLVDSFLTNEDGELEIVRSDR